MVPMKNKETYGYGGEEKKKMATVKKEKEKKNGPAKEGRKERKREERKGKNEMSGPAFLNYKGRDNKIYKITNLPLY